MPPRVVVASKEEAKLRKLEFSLAFYGGYHNNMCDGAWHGKTVRDGCMLCMA